MIFNESYTFKNVKLKESADKKLYMEGLIFVADVKNQNNRIYPDNILDSAFRKYDEVYVKDGRAYGELDHPVEEEYSNQVNLERASHRFIKVWKKGKEYFGRALILNTPNGNVLKALLENGGKLGFSLRAHGDVEEKGGTTYVTRLDLITAGDVVHEPSMPGAFFKAVMESVKNLNETLGLKKYVNVNSLLMESSTSKYTNTAVNYEEIFKEYIRDVKYKCMEGKIDILQESDAKEITSIISDVLNAKIHGSERNVKMFQSFLDMIKINRDILITNILNVNNAQSVGSMEIDASAYYNGLLDEIRRGKLKNIYTELFGDVVSPQDFIFWLKKDYKNFAKYFKYSVPRSDELILDKNTFDGYKIDIKVKV